MRLHSRTSGLQRLRPRVLVLAVCFAAIGGTPAYAQDDGVFVDPNSPSGKEYAIPLEDARRRADPSRPLDAKVRQGARESPLFGEGIEEDPGVDPAPAGEEDSGSGASGASGTGGTTTGVRHGGGDNGGAVRVDLPPTAAMPPARADSSTDIHTLLLLGLAALALVGSGLGLGRAMRRCAD